MKSGLSSAFKNMVRQFDYDQIQFMIWQYEDGLAANWWSEDDRQTVVNIIVYLSNLIGVEPCACKSLLAIPICLN